MKDIINIAKLFDTYGMLLSAKQARYIELYYFEDMSLAEIANQYNISRAAIHDAIHVATKEITRYEAALMIVSKKDQRVALYEKFETNPLVVELRKIDK